MSSDNQSSKEFIAPTEVSGKIDLTLNLTIDEARYDRETGVLTYSGSNPLGFKFKATMYREHYGSIITHEGMEKIARDLIGTGVKSNVGN